MRTETREVTIEQEVYIAADGEEFDTPEECEEYEARLVGQKLKLYGFRCEPCDFVEDCMYAKLDTQEEIDSFIALCKHDGINYRGIDGPGVYLSVEGAYGYGKGAWCNVSEIIKSLEESEDTVSGN